MKLLLTSAGVTNASIRDSLVGLLGKSIAACDALCIPTAEYGHPICTPASAWRFVSGKPPSPMCGPGWKSLGLLELTALPSIAALLPTLHEKLGGSQRRQHGDDSSNRAGLRELEVACRGRQHPGHRGLLGARALMRASCFSLLVFLAGAADAAAADSAPAAFLNRLKALAGASSQDCGSVPLQGDREPAIACAKDAHSSANAYRVAFQLRATGSSIWQGAARDGHGKLWVAFYDLDPSGGPTLSTLPCREILFVADGGEVLDCQPISAAP